MAALGEHRPFQPRYRSAIGNRLFKNNSTFFFLLRVFFFFFSFLHGLFFRCSPWASCREALPRPHSENMSSGASKNARTPAEVEVHQMVPDHPQHQRHQVPLSWKPPLAQTPMLGVGWGLPSGNLLCSEGFITQCDISKGTSWWVCSSLPSL